MEFTLLWAALLGMGMLWAALWLEDRAELLGEGRRVAFDRALVAAVAALAVGRLAAMISTGTNPWAHPGDIVIVRGGVDTGFAALTALGWLLWSARQRLPAALDELGPAALAGLAGWHAGCLFRGTCLGARSDLPWAVAQRGSEVSRHPTEIYAALLLLATAAAAFWWLRRGPRLGLVGFSALAAAGAIRWLTEPLRPSLGAGPVGWYAAAVAVGLTGLLWQSLRRGAVGSRSGPVP